MDLVSSQDLIQDTVPPVKQTKGLTVRPNGHFQVQIWYRGKSRYVGSYSTQDEAASAYQIADEVLFMTTPRSTEQAKKNNSLLIKRVREMIAENRNEGETCLQCTSVSACNSPHQGDKIIAAYYNDGETCLQRTSVLACNSPYKCDIVCKEGETCLQHTCVSACDSPIQNNISNHVSLQCSICACFLTNDIISRRQLIHKRQHNRKCIACVNLHLTIDACQYVTCATMKRREDFSYRQWSKPNNAKKCLSCVQHLMSDGCPAG